MRSPVQIWLAAPVKPVVPQGIAGFYFFFHNMIGIEKPTQKPTPPKKELDGAIPVRLFLMHPGKFGWPASYFPDRRGYTFGE